MDQSLDTNVDTNQVRAQVELARFLVFRLGTDYYGLGMGEVIEVLKRPVITPVPFTQKNVLGITNLRGYPLVICDLRISLRIQSKEEAHFIIVCEVGADKIGLAVDFVEDVYAVPIEDVKPDTSVSKECKERQIFGILTREKMLIYLIDLKNWFESARFTYADT